MSALDRAAAEAWDRDGFIAYFRLDRCDHCHWPLARTPEKGCVEDNCSMRPMPHVDPGWVQKRRHLRAALARIDAAEAERDRLRALLVDVGSSGVSFDDERISWCEVQIERETYQAARAIADEEERAAALRPAQEGQDAAIDS